LEEEQQLKEVFKRYANNECTEQEVKFLLSHFKVNDSVATLRSIIAAKLNEYTVADIEKVPQTKPAFDAIFNNILDNIAGEQDEKEVAKPKKKGPQLLKFIAGITVVLIVFQSLYVYYRYTGAKKTHNVVVENIPEKTGITPGSNKAVLTLEDGSTIILNDAQNGTLAQQGNANVVKLANGQLVYDKTDAQPDKVLYNTMTTPRGGQYKLTLPDGTDVWLNSASSITYPTSFVGNERNVSITGEAYFEVAKDKTKPFHVNAGRQTIEVLGTHFNVMAYADEDVIKTTLLEGLVKVTGGKESGMLKPGEQSVIDKSGDLKVSAAAVDEALAWKDGYFKFNRVNIKYIMRQLARWYDVDVVYEGKVQDDEFVGKIGRGENITEVLRILELSHVHFKISDKKIIVLP
jgi:transmembrane sensor